MSTWMKIAWAIPIIIMIALLWPRAQIMMEESRQAEPGDWKSAIVPIGLVIAFVVLLIWMV